MARARVTILRSIILDLNFLDLRKKEIRIELTHPDVIYFNRGPVSKAPFHSCLAISITEAITKCRLGGRFSPSIVIFIVFVHGFRASVPSSVSRNSFQPRFQPVISVTLQKSSEMLAFPLKPSRVVRHVTSRSLTNPRSNLVSFQKKERSLDFSFERESK